MCKLSSGLACSGGLLFIFICVWGFALVKTRAHIPEWYLWIWVLPVFIARPTPLFTGVSKGLLGASRGWEGRKAWGTEGLIVDFRVCFCQTKGHHLVPKNSSRCLPPCVRHPLPLSTYRSASLSLPQVDLVAHAFEVHENILPLTVKFTFLIT